MDTDKFILFLRMGYLEGNIDRFRVRSDCSGISSEFSSVSLIGKVRFKIDGLGDMEYGVGDPNKLLKILGVMGESIDIKVNTAKSGIELTDGIIKSNYMILDLSILKKVPKLNDKIVFNVKYDLDNDFIEKYLRSSSALNDTATVSYVENKEGNIFSIGYTTQKNSDFISLNLPKNSDKENTEYRQLTFNKDLLKDIFKNIKSLSKISMGICYDGLMKIFAEDDEFSCEYYLTQITTK